MKTQTQITFKKFDTEKQIVYGIVYAPMVADSQGDWASHESIEKMAHEFNAKNRANAIDVEHNLKPSGAVVVESFVARKGDQDFPAGCWAMGIRTPDNIWGLVKSGKINGLSMYGKCSRIDKGLPNQPTAKHELIDTEIEAVSLVGRAANQETFTMTKSADPVQQLAAQFSAIADAIEKTATAMREGFATQQAQIDQLAKGKGGLVVRKAAPVTNPNAGKIDYQRRKMSRLEAKLDTVWERPDLQGEANEGDLRRGIAKCEDELHALGYEAPRAGLDSNCAFFQRGGTSNFLQASESSIADILGVNHATRDISKSDEDAINVTNNLVL